MPRRPSGKRASAPSVFDVADAMEGPLAHAEDMVRALEYVGYGMARHDEDGAPAVLGIARSLADDIATARKSWQRLYGLRETLGK